MTTTPRNALDVAAQRIEAEIVRFGQTDPGDPVRAGLIEGYRDSLRIVRAALYLDEEDR